MARLINGPCGLISGKAGGVVYYAKNGYQHVRKLPKPSSKQPSEKQLIQREKFATVMRFLSPVRNILNDNYRRYSSKKTGLQHLAKQFLADAITGEYPNFSIDYSKVLLLRGRLTTPLLEMEFDGPNEFKLSWRVFHDRNSYLNDELFALIYCPSLQRTWYEINTGILRSEQNGFIKLPAQFRGHEKHIWLGFRSEMMGYCSSTVYMGMFLNAKSESHEIN